MLNIRFSVREYKYKNILKNKNVLIVREKVRGN